MGEVVHYPNTWQNYTAKEDTSEADLVVPELGDKGCENVTIKILKDILT